MAHRDGICQAKCILVGPDWSRKNVSDQTSPIYQGAVREADATSLARPVTSWRLGRFGAELVHKADGDVIGTVRNHYIDEIDKIASAAA